jgi:hypothetical protein
MLLPPQNLKATYSAGIINISWNTAATSDTPTAVEITLANKTTTVQQAAPTIATSYAVPAATVSKFAGTTVSITVAYSVGTAQHTNAITSVAVPGTPPPPPPTVGAPTNLSVVYDPATHSVEFHWANHGLNSGNYDKVLVQWGVVTNPNPVQLPDLPGTTTQAGPLGPIYPNTNYVFKVEGGTYAGLTGFTYTGWTILDWRSPDGPPPFVGWLKFWFQIHPETALQPTQPGARASFPGRHVTALWGIGSRTNHLDLFLAGGIPTLGETWWDYWEPQPGWVPWLQASNAVWALNVSVALGSEITAVWRPNDTHLDLFAIADDGTVWSTWWEPDAGWQKWFSIFPNIKMAPGASITAVWRPNATHLDLFVCGTAGAMGMAWSTWWEPNHGWQPWFSVSNAAWALNVYLKPGAKVTALWRDSNHLDVFGTANDGSIWSTWYESGPGWQKWFAVPNPTAFAAPGSPVTALWTPTLHLPRTLRHRRRRTRHHHPLDIQRLG